jgi:hypothetical protein
MIVLCLHCLFILAYSSYLNHRIKTVGL